MRYYPVYLDLRGRSCVVVGGGEVATRKVESLLAAGARVTVVSPSVSATLAAMTETHEILHHARPYRRGDLQGAVLAYAATNDKALHAEIAAEAAAASVLLNVVDRPSFCSFIAPALMTRGAVSVAVSTGGASPALASRLRRDIEKTVGPEYGLAAAILGELRPIVGGAEIAPAERARVFRALADSPLLGALRARDAAAVDAILEAHVGPGTTLAVLGVSLDAAGTPHRDDEDAQDEGADDGTPAA